MAKAPGKAKDFDGAGKVWFKIFEITPHADPAGIKEITYPSTSESSLAVRILIIVHCSVTERHFHHSKERPHRTVSIVHRIVSSEANHPRYLLRIENIGLHGAHNLGGAQFFLACAQIDVRNGGNGSPGPLVSIPGLYTGNVCTYLVPLLTDDA